MQWPHLAWLRAQRHRGCVSAAASPSLDVVFSSRNPWLSGWPGWTPSLILSWRGCENRHIKGDVHFKSRVWKESCVTYEIGIEMVELLLFQKAQRLNSWRNLQHIIFDTSISQMRNLNLEICFSRYCDCNSGLASLTSGGCSLHFAPCSPFLGLGLKRRDLRRASFCSTSSEDKA